jgi:hypothetical protein
MIYDAGSETNCIFPRARETANYPHEQHSNRNAHVAGSEINTVMMQVRKISVSRFSWSMQSDGTHLTLEGGIQKILGSALLSQHRYYCHGCSSPHWFRQHWLSCKFVVSVTNATNQPFCRFVRFALMDFSFSLQPIILNSPLTFSHTHTRDAGLGSRNPAIIRGLFAKRLRDVR